MAKTGKVIVIAGPTGSGESSITRAILKKLKNTERIITATTRKPRPHEKDGTDYFFLSPKKFTQMIKQGKFLEYIKIPNRGIYYGTIKEKIEKKLSTGTNLIGNFEKLGIQYFRKAFPGRVLGIFIKPKDIEVIKQRLIKRDPTISPLEIKQRLVNARREMKEEKYYDYAVLNLDKKMGLAVKEVLNITRKFIKTTP